MLGGEFGRSGNPDSILGAGGWGLGERVNGVEGAAGLRNSLSKEEGTGEGGREQRSEGGRKGGREGGRGESQEMAASS
jgi:hypothetical protein